MKRNDMTIGSQHPTKRYGMLEIVEYRNARDISVVFLDTGYAANVEAVSIRRGVVRDRLLPTICGVGYLGVGSYKAAIDRQNTLEYIKWNGMIRRCYDSKMHNKMPWYAECTVVPEWHNFQNFAEWFHSNHPNDGRRYDSDKDLLSGDVKEYGPDTCSFISSELNTMIASGTDKTWWVFRHVSGEVRTVYNHSQFAKEVGSSQGNINAIINAPHRSSHGWRWVKTITDLTK